MPASKESCAPTLPRCSLSTFFMFSKAKVTAGLGEKDLRFQFYRHIFLACYVSRFVKPNSNNSPITYPFSYGVATVNCPTPSINPSLGSRVNLLLIYIWKNFLGYLDFLWRKFSHQKSCRIIPCFDPEYL